MFFLQRAVFNGVQHIHTFFQWKWKYQIFRIFVDRLILNEYPGSTTYSSITPGILPIHSN